MLSSQDLVVWWQMNYSCTAKCVEPSTLSWMDVAALDGVHVGTPEAAADVQEGSEGAVVGGSGTPLTKIGLEDHCLCGVAAGGQPGIVTQLSLPTVSVACLRVHGLSMCGNFIHLKHLFISIDHAFEHESCASLVYHLCQMGAYHNWPHTPAFCAT
jgi:hypothetical protein